VGGLKLKESGQKERGDVSVLSVYRERRRGAPEREMAIEEGIGRSISEIS
jgi:hypothetical protein